LVIRATSDSGSFLDYPITRLSNSPIPPSVFPVILAGFTAFLDLYATQPLLPLLMRVFKTTHFAVSLTVTASTIGVAIAAPVVGRLADFIGRRRVIVGSAFVVTAATALAATSTNLTQFIGWRFVEGLATPGVFGIAIAYVHDEWPTSHVGRAMAAYVSGTVIGGFCGRALVGLVASRYDWHLAFAALAVANLVAAVLLAFVLPGETRKASTPSRDHGQSIARLIANPQLIGTNAVGFCVLFMQVAMFSYVTFHLSAEPYLLSTAALGWLFVVYLFGAGVMPFAGRWIDVRGHRAALASSMAMGVTGALLTLAPWLPAIVAGLALVGTGVFAAQATASSYIGAVTHEDRGLAVGLYSTCYYLGGSAGGVFPALFWDAGGWPACVALVLFVQVTTVTIALRSWRPTHAHVMSLDLGP
jgi:MFS transporter, YNFM family, putative membrane transport protein